MDKPDDRCWLLRQTLQIETFERNSSGPYFQYFVHRNLQPRWRFNEFSYQSQVAMFRGYHQIFVDDRYIDTHKQAPI